MFLGSCDVASETSLSANIKKKRSYNQHMTIGLFRGLKLPNVVLKNQNGYKKKIAEEYLDINLLTKVEAQLIDGNLEKWVLKFASETGNNYIFLNLVKSEQSVLDFESTSDVDREKLRILVKLLWDNCYTIYEFALSTSYVLESADSKEILKTNLMEIIANIRTQL